MSALPRSASAVLGAARHGSGRRALGAAIACALLCAGACSATEGPLLLRLGDAHSDAGGSPLRAAVVSNMTLQYQISGTLDSSQNAQLYVVDLFDTSAAQVAALHAAGRIVIGYVSAGSFEPWRADADRFPRAAIGKPLANYPDESWLDPRSDAVRALMMARLQRALDAGFDGVFLSTVGSYKADSGFTLAQSDELDYQRFLTGAAHGLGLSAGLSGDFDLSAQLGAEYDWVLATGCIAANSCDALRPWLALGKPVFDLETQGTQDEVCARAASYGIATTRKHDAYDAWRMPCP
jgi:hypothetical protein